MKDIHAADELDRLGGLIEDNIGISGFAKFRPMVRAFPNNGPRSWSQRVPAIVPGPAKASNRNDLTEQLNRVDRLRGNELNLRDQTGISGPGQGHGGQLQSASRHAGPKTRKKCLAILMSFTKKPPLPQL